MFVEPISVSETINVIKSLRSEYSSHNEIIVDILEKCSIFSNPYHHSFQISVSNRVFSSSLSHGMVFLVHKSGTLDDANNYKPVSRPCVQVVINL